MARTMISRRTMLRGVGGAAIALPALDVLQPRVAVSAPEGAPVRLITMFFGQGLPPSMFEQPASDSPAVFEGSLEPLAPFASKLALLTKVSHVSGSGDPHDVGPQSCFTGFALKGKGPGGPSIDQVALDALHPDGAPTRIPTLSTGSFHREGGFLRHVHSWKANLTPAALPVERPEELFRQLFAQGVTPSEPSADELKRKRYQKSVLDAVRDAYQHAQGDSSGYGVATKRRISDHLERIRELEKRVFAPRANSCVLPENPGALKATKAQATEKGGGGAGGVDIDAGEWQEVWRNLIDLYVLGLSCDLTRFGNVIFQSGGDRVRVHGDYTFNGKLIAEFDDKETTHEYFHDWREQGNNRLVEQHLHFIMAQIAYFLGKMDETESAPGGPSLLDDSLVMISTELGNPSSHSYRDVFHAISGCGGRFKTGVVHQAPRDTRGPDLYNACLQGLGVEARMGDERARQEELTSILA